MNGCPRLAWLWLPRENINGNNSQIALRYNGKIPTRIPFRSWRQACKKYSITVGQYRAPGRKDKEGNNKTLQRTRTEVNNSKQLKIS